MIRRREILKSAVLLATAGVAPADFAATAPDADAVLRKVVQTYAALTSYEDSGTVTNYDGSESPYRLDFTTTYKSPLFRFQFATPHPYAPLRQVVTRYDVGFDGTAAYFVTTPYEKPPQSVPTKDLNQALARATGISSGAAHTISRLLLRDISGLSILDLVEARLLDDAMIDGSPCYAVSAQHPRGGAWDLWIQKDSLLLRKLRRNNGAQGQSYSEEVRDHIRVNQPIDDARFKVEV